MNTDGSNPCPSPSYPCSSVFLLKHQPHPLSRKLHLDGQINRTRAALVVERYIDESSLGHLVGVAVGPVDPGLDRDGYGGAAYLRNLRIAGDDVADQDRLMEAHAGDGDGGNPALRAPHCSHRAGS